MLFRSAMLGSEFAGSYAKLRRAVEHHEALKTEISKWCNSDKYSTARERNGDGSRYSIIARFKVFPDVERWGLMMADCVNNLRSALDHFLYAIAVRQTGIAAPPDGNRIQFPICSDAQKFTDERNRRNIRSLSDPVWAAIVREQPYNRPKSDLPPLLSLDRKSVV